MPLKLDTYDEALAARIVAAMKEGILTAHNPVAVAKRIAVQAVKLRNPGRIAAIKRHPFKGICEVSGLSLSKDLAVLDEVEPEKGYEGDVRWVCQRANNSGKHSCGGCR